MQRLFMCMRLEQAVKMDLYMFMEDLVKYACIRSLEGMRAHVYVSVVEVGRYR
jgi:hypothetical protein